MKKIIYIICTLILFSLFNIKVSASSLDDIKNRGYLICGVSEDFVGFSTLTDNGEWVGFDVDLCRAVAVAVFGDSTKVSFLPVTSRSRFPLLSYGEIDLLTRNTTWSYSRDVNLEFEYSGITFYDGQAFMVQKELGIKSIYELSGSTICLVSGSSNELNTKFFFEENSLKYKPVLLESYNSCEKNYINGNCDVYTADLTVLANSRAKMPDYNNHFILPEIISKEPLGLLVRHGDNQWGDIVRWTLNVLIIAEEKKLNSQNIDNYFNSNDPEILRMIGEIGNYGEMLELDNKWAYNIIKQIGNYSTIYEKNLGVNTLLGLERGLNNLWKNGGILYSPPFR